MCATTSSRRRLEMLVLGTCLAVLCASYAQALRPNSAVDIEPKGQVAVRLGESLKILCKTDSALRVCRIEIPGENSIILSPDQPAEDGIEYYGNGTQHGQCGVLISKIIEKHDGIFRCALTPMDVRTEILSTLKIVVAKPPGNPELLVSPGLYGRNTYKKGEKLQISCSAPSGRPAANVSLYLDDEPIGNEERPTIYDSNIDDNSLAVQNVSRSLDWTDNGKVLRCLANHIALDRPKETSLQLNVYYPPQPQPTIERFGYVIGRQGIVNVTVYANPRPHFLWRVNDEKINLGMPDESNRIETSTAVELGRGAWSVILSIDSVQKSDTEKEYILEARNDEGASEYRIVLSTSSEPAGVDLDAGSIIGIVVGVLVLILIVFLVIFARATGRWCFADGSANRNVGETSDTESAGRYSRSEVDSTSSRPRRPKMTFSQLFKRNKDKISGTDTDTVRTVVTVDDEKTPASEQTTDVSATTTVPAGEGGLVYAELDLKQQQQGAVPRRVSEDKTEYAEILYTKPETEEDRNNK
ncbi:fasciclin-3 isoform X2 [Orussus abietinus]|uniref:fasciclin-3 isoform X2 n=1 Tax=Orussus abietinus TaxID=222816 RepID=UPI0006266F84|nr:fasciclin-3 isoform X2 [Orussus abietinus]